MVAKQTRARDKENIKYYCKNKCGAKSIKHSIIDEMFGVYMNNSYQLDISKLMLGEYGKNDELLNINKRIIKYENKLIAIVDSFNEDCLSFEQYQTQIRKANKKYLI